MRGLRLSLALTAALAAAACLPAPAAAGPESLRYVSADRLVAGGRIAELTLRCPPGWTVLSGALVRNARALPVAHTRPLGAVGWVFGLDNRADATRAPVRLTIVCLKVRPPAGARRYSLLRSSTRVARVVLGPEGRRAFVVRCPAGQAPVGFGGGNPTGGDGARAADFGRLGGGRIQGARPIPGGWRFDVFSDTGQPSSYEAIARCAATRALSGRMRGGRRLRPDRASSLRVLRQGLTRVVRPGNNDGLRGSCPRGTRAIRTAHDFGDASAGVFTSWAGPGRVGTWNLVSREMQPTSLRLYLLCLRAEGWRRLSR